MMKMWAGQIIGSRRLEIVELPIPEIQQGEMLVQLEVGSICGSDLPYFLCNTSHPLLFGSSVPLAPTLSLHELVGFVVETKTERFRKGDRVLALPATHHGGLAEYFVSKEDRAVHIPAGPAKHLVLSQPLGTVVHACSKLPELSGQTVVILGQGPIGQLFTAMMRHRGVERLIAVDVLGERLKVSKAGGATHTVCGSAGDVIEEINTITDGKLADLAVEAIGKPDTLNVAAKLVRRNGTVLGFGVPSKFNYEFAFHEFFNNEGRLICSVGPTVEDLRAAVEMISNAVIDVAPLVTHTFPFSRAQEAYTLFADRADGVIKVALVAE